tara:strand:- start:79 stop:513 length:435 start_codon:yes stop_codon:yes gene_type:complete
MSSNKASSSLVSGPCAEDNNEDREVNAVWAAVACCTTAREVCPIKAYIASGSADIARATDALAYCKAYSALSKPSMRPTGRGCREETSCPKSSSENLVVIVRLLCGVYMVGGTASEKFREMCLVDTLGVLPHQRGGYVHRSAYL